MNNLGKNLLFLRKNKGLIQDEIPVLIGVSRVTWSNYENNVTQPDIDTLIKISDVFFVSIDDICKEDLQKNVHLIKKMTVKNNGENVHLNVHPNVPGMVNEPEIPYETEKKQQVDLLILKQLNTVASDVKAIREKLEK